MSEKLKVDPDLGIEINGPGRQYFDSVITDNMMDALVELSATIWIVRDRQIVLEKVLAKQGIDVEPLIEAHVPDEQELQARAQAREDMVQRIFRSFVRRPNDKSANDADVPSLRKIED